MLSADFLHGCGIGLAVAAPVGPIGVLCIQRTLAGGRLSGFISGLGAATADALYGMIAAFGLTVVSRLLVEQQSWLRLGGGLFLVLLAARAVFSPSPTARPAASRWTLGAAFASTLVLTLANPATILSFVAIFAGLGLAGRPGHIAGAVMVSGVFVGSALWWLVLCQTIGLLRHRLDPRLERATRLLSAAMLGGFGIYALVGAF